jgi:hypothetical protein
MDWYKKAIEAANRIDPGSYLAVEVSKHLRPAVHRGKPEVGFAYSLGAVR